MCTFHTCTSCIIVYIIYCVFAILYIAYLYICSLLFIICVLLRLLSDYRAAREHTSERYNAEWDTLRQGFSNLSLEGQSAAELSSNPDQTHLPVIF